MTKLEAELGHVMAPDSELKERSEYEVTLTQQMLNMRIKEKEGTTKELRKELCMANETYDDDVKQRADNEFSEKLENKTSQPVTGKCYHCTRTIESIKS